MRGRSRPSEAPRLPEWTRELTLKRDLVGIEPFPDDIRCWPVNISLQQKLIVAPEAHAEPSRFAVVLALGDGKMQDGTQYEFSVKCGDIIMCERYPHSAQQIKYRGQTIITVREPEILAVIERS